MLFAALTNHHPEKLERLIVSVNRQFFKMENLECVVICNTLDEEYPKVAEALATKYGWKFKQTESNGKPGKGKNSVFDYFVNETDQDSLFMMDGDDVLYPTAFGQLNQITVRVPKLDVLGLQTNDCIDNEYFEEVYKLKLVQNTWLYSWFDCNDNMYLKPENFNKINKSLPLGVQTTPDRIVYFSRKAAKLLRCSEELNVFEDYVLSEASQYFYLLNELSYYNTADTCIYVYDKTVTDSACRKFVIENNNDWGRQEALFNQEVGKYRVVTRNFSAARVPFFKTEMPSFMTPELRKELCLLYLL